VTGWRDWAPPLDPPTTGGLPVDDAARIAAAYWRDDPHLCAALQWEAYAATLPPAASVSQVQTGMQSVTYSPPMPGGSYGEAISRAQWHRSFCTSLHSFETRAVVRYRPNPGPAWHPLLLTTRTAKPPAAQRTATPPAAPPRADTARLTGHVRCHRRRQHPRPSGCNDPLRCRPPHTRACSRQRATVHANTHDTSSAA